MILSPLANDPRLVSCLLVSSRLVSSRSIFQPSGWRSAISPPSGDPAPDVPPDARAAPPHRRLAARYMEKASRFPKKSRSRFFSRFPGDSLRRTLTVLPDRPCGGCDLGHQKRWLVLYSVEAIWWIRSMTTITSHRFSLRSLAQVSSSVLTCVLMSSETAERAALYRGAISLQNASVSGFLISLTAHSFCIS